MTLLGPLLRIPNPPPPPMDPPQQQGQVLGRYSVNDFTIGEKHRLLLQPHAA